MWLLCTRTSSATKEDDSSSLIGGHFSPACNLRTSTRPFRPHLPQCEGQYKLLNRRCSRCVEFHVHIEKASLLRQCFSILLSLIRRRSTLRRLDLRTHLLCRLVWVLEETQRLEDNSHMAVRLKIISTKECALIAPNVRERIVHLKNTFESMAEGLYMTFPSMDLRQRSVLQFCLE